MKQLLFALTLAVAAAGTLYYVRRPPAFVGKYAAVHEDLWKFPRESDPGKKYALAMRIYAGPVMADLESSLKKLEDASAKLQKEVDALVTGGKSAGNGDVRPGDEEKLVLSEEERKVAAEAQRLVESTAARLEEFEAKLTPVDIDFLTQSNPDAFARRTHVLHVKGDCTPEQYAALREKVGAQKLQDSGASLMTLVSANEAKFSAEYAGHEVEILRREERFRDYRDLADTIFSDSAKSAFPQIAAPPQAMESRIKEAEDDLVKQGFERSTVRGYALDLAAGWPTCLGKVSLPFVRLLQKDTTTTRGAALLEKIKEYVKTKRKAPDDLDAVGTPLPLDGWYHPFLLSRRGQVLRLSSSGPDGRENTEDDLLIGEVPLSVESFSEVVPSRSRTVSVMLDRTTWTKGAASLMTAGLVTMPPTGGCKMKNLEPGGIYHRLGLREGDLVLRTNFGAPKSAVDCLTAFSRVSTKALRSLEVRGPEKYSVKIQVGYR